MAGPVAEFGQLIVPTDVDRAFIDSLRLWLPTYLTWVERARELTPHLLARPTEDAYQNALEDDEFPDSRLPAIVVTTAQAEDADYGPNNELHGSWRVNVSAIVKAQTPPQVREVAALFGGCVAKVIHDQQTALEGEIKLARPMQVAPVADVTGKNRFLAAGICQFVAYVDNVMTGTGPVDPDPDDPIYLPPDPSDPDATYDPLSTVSGVTIDVKPLED